MADNASLGPTVYTSSLTTTQTANIMMQPQRADVKFIGYPEETRVTVIIKNLNTNAECVLTRTQKCTPNFATEWMHSHIGHSFFRNIDFGAIARWPLLACPDGTALFTTCTFPNGVGETLQAMAFQNHGSKHSQNTDTIVVRISAPLMHSSQLQYQRSNFRDKRYNAIQHAFRAFAKENKHVDTTEAEAPSVDPLIASLYYNDTIAPLGIETQNFNFAIRMPTTEKTAGTSTIPAILKTLHFLIPGLDAGNVVYYDILQGHKSAYVFRLRNVAGWRILGAVNTTLPSFDITNTVFQKYTPSLERHMAISESILTIFPGNQSLLKAQTQRMLVKYHKRFMAQLADTVPGSHLIAAFANLSKLTFKIDDLILLDEQAWELFVTFQGLKYIHEFFMNSDTTTASTDALLRRILYALQVEDPKNIKPFSKHETALFVDSFFDACVGFAKELISDLDIATSADLAKELLHPQFSREVYISIDEAIAILTTCMGKDPMNWHEAAAKDGIFKQNTHLAAFMLLRGGDLMEHYKLLFPAELFSDIADTIKNAHNYEKKINNARDIFNNLKTSAKNEMHSGLGYALFTGDYTTFPGHAAAITANNKADEKRRTKRAAKAAAAADAAATAAAAPAGADAADPAAGD